MDSRTITEYEGHAVEFCERYRGLEPSALRDIAKGFFHPDGWTADLGCGSGRDVAWLESIGCPSVGYDAAANMLAYARASFPECRFERDSLPDLTAIESGTLANVLCSGVIMHLRREDLITACTSLSRILRPGGRLLLSYRGPRGADEREDDGRLFTAIPRGKLVLLLESVGFRVLLETRQPDTTRTDVLWEVVLAEKGPLDRSSGLERVQSILVQDAKVATYKLALIRAFCRIGRNQSHVVRWIGGSVYVPMWSVAVEWLAYYWPLVTAPEFVAQIRGESEASSKPIAFRRAIEALADTYGAGGLWLLLRDLETAPGMFTPHLRRIAGTIEKGPVTYAGTRRDPVFHFVKKIEHGEPGHRVHGVFGWIGVPESIWLDICRFDHWIEDSVVLRWAALSAEMNPRTTTEQYLPYVLASAMDVRETQEVRKALDESGRPLECVWTARSLSLDYHVDHAIPYSVWGNNDSWNLLPCDNRANMRKSDRLPSLSLVRERSDCIVSYWRLYRECLGHRFEVQMARALGCAPGSTDWEGPALGGLQESIQRLATTRGLGFWEP